MHDATHNTGLKHYLEWVIINLVVIGLLIWLIGLPTLLLSFIFKWQRPSKQYTLVIYALATLFLIPISTQLNQLDLGLFPPLTWWLSIPLFPLVYLLLEGLIMLSRFSKPRSLQEQLKQYEQDEARRLKRLADRAGDRSETKQNPSVLRLGAKIKGDIFPKRLGVGEEKGWVTIDENVLDQHMFILGTTGAGKSEAIKRIIYEAFTATNRNLYLVDGKGDSAFAEEVRALAAKHGRGQAPIYKLGFDKSGAVYDGFRGQPTDIYNRICALIGLDEAEGNARFYADVSRDILQLVCYAPEGAPRNFEELRTRLSRRWLLKAYKDDFEERGAIEELDEKNLQGLVHRIRPLVREFSSSIGDDGFSLEDTPCAIFSLRVQSVGDTAQRFLNFLIEDLKDFIGKRQKEPALLILDEFTQFDNDTIASILSLARSSQLGVILACQDVAGLKDEKTQKLVLANTRTKLLMASDFPEDIAQLAGTAFQIEASTQIMDGDATGMGSARTQHAFKIDMNEAAKLAAGEAFLIRQRHVVKFKVRQIEQPPLIEPQKEEKRQKKQKSKQPENGRSKKRPRTL